jgi:hypothetical protein
MGPAIILPIHTPCVFVKQNVFQIDKIWWIGEWNRLSEHLEESLVLLAHPFSPKSWDVLRSAGKWPLFQIAYMTGLAYVAALVVYQVLSRLGHA